VTAAKFAPLAPVEYERVGKVGRMRTVAVGATSWQHRDRDDRSVARGGDPALVGRNAEVAQLVAEGLSNLEVAAMLGISPRNVSTRLYEIYGRLGIRNRKELAERMSAPTRVSADV